MDNEHKNKRWWVLSFSVFLLFAAYFSTHVPAALKDILEEDFKDYLSKNEFEFFFNSLYAMYSLPNIILPLINGILIDKVGLRVMLFSLAFIATMGSILFASGLTKHHIIAAIIGRFIFGIGSESLLIATIILLASYFSDKELSLAFTINLSIASIGTFLNMNITPRWAASYGSESAVWVGPAICCLALGSVIALLKLDTHKYYDQDIYIFNRRQTDFEPHGKIITVNELKKLGRMFWYLAGTNSLMVASILSWVNIGPSYIIDKLEDDQDIHEAQIDGSFFLSLMWLSSAVSAPIVGHFLDVRGARTKVMIFASILCTVSISMFIFVYPLIPSVLLGIAYASGLGSTFPSITYVVPKEKLGKANGVVISLYNAGCSAFPYMVAAIKVTYGSYDYATLLLSLTSMIAIYFAWKSHKQNKKKGYNLEKEVQLMEKRNKELLVLRSRENSQDNTFDYQILNSSDRMSYSKMNY